MLAGSTGKHIAQGGPAWERPGARPAESGVLMRIEDLSLHAGGRELQKGLNFEVFAGEVLAIVGASG
ncbi:hypothetical protein [Roseateles sp.]|uniref:hypothetical protein n=1 Tax=Roseateles sp. TaxID=1971397 RepID=UPI00326587C1